MPIVSNIEKNKIQHLKRTGFPYSILNKLIDYTNHFINKFTDLIISNNAIDQALPSKEDKYNKVADWITYDQNSYPTAALVKETLDNVMETAEGKSKAYVSNVTVHIETRTTENVIEIPYPIRDYNQNIVWDENNLPKVGDILYILEPDYPDRWVVKVLPDKVIFGKLETTSVNLSKYVDSVEQGHKVLHLWKGTQQEYDNMDAHDSETLYIITE